MGTKRVQKTRTVQKRQWNSSIGAYETVPATETYWDTEYVSDSGSSSFSADNSSSGGYGE